MKRENTQLCHLCVGRRIDPPHFIAEKISALSVSFGYSIVSSWGNESTCKRNNHLHYALFPQTSRKRISQGQLFPVLGNIIADTETNKRVMLSGGLEVLFQSLASSPEASQLRENGGMERAELSRLQL
ncbi:hypothetical protein Y1Q_0002045 [Alligator mississippiensis]|uniref:Uncharacterized protein n=1 Tax=Alligator mississippiensis TaxID=8496 RepID=A0A151MIQ4_ALLMI|nr:hypothetical protein Y1Q_0002045 [Alligator mississippiensis]